jgi:hypothetical protein
MLSAAVAPCKYAVQRSEVPCCRLAGQGRVKVPSAGRPRRGRRSLVRQPTDETHGKRRPWMFEPYGVEYLLAPWP